MSEGRMGLEGGCGGRLGGGRMVVRGEGEGRGGRGEGGRRDGNQRALTFRVRARLQPESDPALPIHPHRSGPRLLSRSICFVPIARPVQLFIPNHSASFPHSGTPPLHSLLSHFAHTVLNAHTALLNIHPISVYVRPSPRPPADNGLADKVDPLTSAWPRPHPRRHRPPSRMSEIWPRSTSSLSVPVSGRTRERHHRDAMCNVQCASARPRPTVHCMWARSVSTVAVAALLQCGL
ncbi:hypothetical protein FKP32DRAFT_60110 [Trametes sanguinea]|nr:hypothetical protein FKP32DRAFT_60110 [Trametes sanguinea]